jgi:ribosomal-protein-alanine N-acetyltransferase
MIETSRLTIRPFAETDFDELLRHRSDPDVMKYLGGVPEAEAVRSRLDFYIEHFNKHGFAMGALIWKETGAFIGVGGLQLVADGSDVEVGYTVNKNFWGQGIATECAVGCLEFGFHDADLKRIIAQTQSANLGSRRVLEKSGMSEFGYDIRNDIEWVVYELAAKQWRPAW